MCGIVGKYNIGTHEPVAEALIRTMCDAIAYRGPDDAGVYLDDTNGLGLGHRRLSIIDLSPMGHQPMGTDADDLWITYNGEVYNFPALRQDLAEKGYHFKSQSDTEVLLYLYREYGELCLGYLRGMFAFAIWDKKQKRLFLARDRIGKKPLFYYFNGKTFIFASEIKCILLDPSVQREIDYQAFSDYFKYQYIPDPKTIYRNIRKLKPGCFMVCTPEGIAEKQYWDVSFSKTRYTDVETTCEALLSLLQESVRIRMISDVPLGAFLSGGIDSSSVVALMARASEKPVTTCSIGFDSKSHDEIRYARIIAGRFQTDHNEFTVKHNAASIIQDLAYYFDEPFADSSAVPTFFVSQLARRRVTVALSGDGGDENFAGYEKYYLDDIENRIRSLLPAAIRATLAPVLFRIFSRFDQRLFQRCATLSKTLGHDADYGFYLTNSDFDDTLWQTCLRDETRSKIGSYDPFSVTSYYYHNADTDNHLSKILYTDLKTYLAGDILVKVDRMSMANSLEVRAPLLDHHVIEFAAAIDPDLKFNRGEKKFVLKRTLQKLLPEETLYRPKMGFSVPLADWMRGELRQLTEDALFARDAGTPLFFDTGALRSLWNRHQTGQRDHGTILWSLLMFEMWFRRFMQ